MIKSRIKLLVTAVAASLATSAVAAVKPFGEILHRWTYGYMQKSGLLLNAAHTAIESLTDSTYAICATLPATYDSAGYGATSLTYTAIGKVESVTPYGSQRPISVFTPIAGAADKTKGTPDYGELDLVFGDVPADAGQVIVKAAEASANHYSIKCTYPDGEIHYLDVLVCSFQYSGGKAGDFKTVTAKCAVCRAPVIIAAT